MAWQILRNNHAKIVQLSDVITELDDPGETGNMQKTGIVMAAIAAIGCCAPFSTTNAADLGGNCCADLEERIAELEATTARKGNRKVSLAVTGWVSNILTWWDDGTEDNVYQTGPGTTLGSNVTFTGQAQISPGWSAGYVLQIEIDPNDPFFTDQNTPNGVFSPGLPSFATGVTALQTYWFIKNDQLGKVSVGKISPYSDNVTIIGVDGSGLGSIFAANSPNFGDFRNFFLRRNGQFIAGPAGNFRWDNMANCWQIADSGAGISMDCTAAPANAVRYDSPVWNGFSFGGSWIEDDMWDIGAHYTGQIGAFKLNVAGSYSINKDASHIVPNSLFGGLIPVTKRDTSYFQIGAYLEHSPTGLFAYGTYGHEFIDSPNAATASPSGFELKDDDAFYLKFGARKQWFPIGHTVPYVEYQQTNDMLDFFALQAGATGSKLERWGVGVMQEIDAAAMSIWLAYKHYDGEITGPAATCATLCGDFDDFQRVEFGGLILF